MQTINGITALVLFRQPCTPMVSLEAARANSNIHVEVGTHGPLTFYAAVGMGDRMVTGMEFEAVPSVPISQAAQAVSNSWKGRTFSGQTPEMSRLLVNSGLLKKLVQLEGAYSTVMELLSRRAVPDFSEPNYYVRELFLTEDGDIFATIEFYQEGPDPVEAVVFVGNLDRCLRHFIGWRPNLLGFSGTGPDGLEAVVEVHVEESAVIAHEGEQARRAIHLLPKSDFRGRQYTVHSLLPPNVTRLNAEAVCV